MGVSSTYDERYGSSTLQAPPGSYDAPDIFGTLYQVAQGMSQSAYGATMPTYGMDVDVDAYSLGTLSPARYTIYVNPTNWGTKPPIVWVNQTPTIEMYRGSTLLTTSSSGSLTFEVFASAGYNVKLSGRTATQYQLYYTATPLTPTVQFSAISGAANEGNTGGSAVTVQATLSAVSTQTVSVPISYSGTASAGTDYTTRQPASPSQLGKPRAVQHSL